MYINVDHTLTVYVRISHVVTGSHVFLLYPGIITHNNEVITTKDVVSLVTSDVRYYRYIDYRDIFVNIVIMI